MSVPLLKIIEDIKAVRSQIKASIKNPSRLATLAVDITTLNSYLGDYIGELKLQGEREWAISYQKHMEEKPSNDRAENYARADTAELRGQIKDLEMLHKGVERIVSTIQTKVRTLEGEAKNQF